MVTTRPPKTIVEPTALGTVANTDTKSLIYGLFQKGRVLAQDGVAANFENAFRIQASGSVRILEHDANDSISALKPVSSELSCDPGDPHTIAHHVIAQHPDLCDRFEFLSLP